MLSNWPMFMDAAGDVGGVVTARIFFYSFKVTGYSRLARWGFVLFGRLSRDEVVLFVGAVHCLFSRSEACSGSNVYNIVQLFLLANVSGIILNSLILLDFLALSNIGGLLVQNVSVSVCPSRVSRGCGGRVACPLCGC